MTKREKLFVILTYAVATTYLFNTTICIFALLGIIALALITKNQNLLKNILAPVLVVVSLFVFRGAMELIFGGVELCINMSGAYPRFFVVCDQVFSLICYLWLAFFTILGVVFAANGQQVWLYGKLTNWIFDTQEEKKAKKVVIIKKEDDDDDDDDDDE